MRDKNDLPQRLLEMADQIEAGTLLPAVAARALRDAAHALAEREVEREVVYLIEGKDADGQTCYWTGLIETGYRADFNYDARCGVHFHLHDYANAVKRAHDELNEFTVVEHGFVYREDK